MIDKIINPVFQDSELLKIYNTARDSLKNYEKDHNLNIPKVISALEILKYEYLVELSDLNNQ